MYGTGGPPQNTQNNIYQLAARLTNDPTTNIDPKEILKAFTDIIPDLEKNQIDPKLKTSITSMINTRSNIQDTEPNFQENLATTFQLTCLLLVNDLKYNNPEEIDSTLIDFFKKSIENLNVDTWSQSLIPHLDKILDTLNQLDQEKKENETVKKIYAIVNDVKDLISDRDEINSFLNDGPENIDKKKVQTIKQRINFIKTNPDSSNPFLKNAANKLILLLNKVKMHGYLKRFNELNPSLPPLKLAPSESLDEANPSNINTLNKAVRTLFYSIIDAVDSEDDVSKNNLDNVEKISLLLDLIADEGNIVQDPSQQPSKEDEENLNFSKLVFVVINIINRDPFSKEIPEELNSLLLHIHLDRFNKLYPSLPPLGLATHEILSATEPPNINTLNKAVTPLFYSIINIIESQDDPSKALNTIDNLDRINLLLNLISDQGKIAQWIKAQDPPQKLSSEDEETLNFSGFISVVIEKIFATENSSFSPDIKNDYINIIVLLGARNLKEALEASETLLGLYDTSSQADILNDINASISNELSRTLEFYINKLIESDSDSLLPTLYVIHATHQILGAIHQPKPASTNAITSTTKSTLKTLIEKIQEPLKNQNKAIEFSLDDSLYLETLIEEVIHLNEVPSLKKDPNSQESILELHEQLDLFKSAQVNTLINQLENAKEQKNISVFLDLLTKINDLIQHSDKLPPQDTSNLKTILKTINEEKESMLLNADKKIIPLIDHQLKYLKIQLDLEDSL